MVAYSSKNVLCEGVVRRQGREEEEEASIRLSLRWQLNLFNWQQLL